MVTHACKPGTLEAEDRLLHSKTLDRHLRKRKGRRKRERSEGDQKEEGREEKNTQSRGTCVQTTYLGRNLHLEYIKNSFKNI